MLAQAVCGLRTRSLSMSGARLPPVEAPEPSKTRQNSRPHLQIWFDSANTTKQAIPIQVIRTELPAFVSAFV
jgi:hypothetical protein